MNHSVGYTPFLRVSKKYNGLDNVVLFIKVIKKICRNS
ncbi:MAG: hypothetical protein RL525_1220 [Bacteroidota bacterium]|jgi:hypothetical protein